MLSEKWGGIIAKSSGGSVEKKFASYAEKISPETRNMYCMMRCCIQVATLIKELQRSRGAGGVRKKRFIFRNLTNCADGLTFIQNTIEKEIIS